MSKGFLYEWSWAAGERARVVRIQKGNGKAHYFVEKLCRDLLGKDSWRPVEHTQTFLEIVEHLFAQLIDGPAKEGERE